MDKENESIAESRSKNNPIPLELLEKDPDIEKAYFIKNHLRQLYNQRTTKDVVMTKLAQWFRDVEKTQFKSFRK